MNTFIYKIIRYLVTTKQLLMLLCFVLLSVSLRSQTLIDAVYKQAGTNKPELEKVLTYYTKVGDQQKLQAAQLFITNFYGQMFYDGQLMKKYDPFFLYLDSLNKNNIEKKGRKTLTVNQPIEDKWNEVSRTFVQSDFATISNRSDASFLTSDQIIKHIDLAFDVWRNRNWAKQYSFGEFCDYILPYKVLNEKPEAWMDYFSTKYQSKLNSMAATTNPVEVADSINKDVETWFNYGSLFSKYPFDMGLTRLLQAHMGTCAHMVTTAIYALRSVGVACAVDHCPQYANRSQGHTWVSILGADKQFVPVNGASQEWLGMGYVFDEQTLNVKLPKVFRKTFSPQTNSLAIQRTNADIIPPMFENPREKDVTAEYQPVTDVKVVIDKQFTKDLKYAYICVFDNKNWVPVWWGKVKNDTVIFKNMGRDIVYLPMSFNGREMKSIGNPLYVNNDGIVKPIKPLKGRAQSLKLFNKYPPNLTGNNDSTNAVLKTDTYELFYWDEKWVSLGKKTTADRQNDLETVGFDFKKKLFLENTQGREFLFYKNVPVGTLFLLHDCTQGKEERIFTIENEEQIWW